MQNLRLVELVLTSESRASVMEWPWSHLVAAADLLRVRHHVTLWYWEYCPADGLAEAWPIGRQCAIEPLGIARGALAEALLVRVNGRTHQHGRPDRLLHITLSFDAAAGGTPAHSVELLSTHPVVNPAPQIILHGTVRERPFASPIVGPVSLVDSLPRRIAGSPWDGAAVAASLSQHREWFKILLPSVPGTTPRDAAYDLATLDEMRLWAVDGHEEDLARLARYWPGATATWVGTDPDGTFGWLPAPGEGRILQVRWC